MVTLILGGITFLAAFLLFQIEFIIAKMFLPAYGGSYLVWGACVVFFQAVLLLGYWFAHQMIGWLGFKNYRYVHGLLVLLPLCFFPLKDLNALVINPSLPLVVDVFWHLTITIGLVFFVLSTMSIVTQMWMSHSLGKGNLNPYRLYAISNLGSFIALFSYPFWIEYQMDIPGQLMVWRWLYYGLVGLSMVAFITVAIQPTGIRSQGPSKVSKEDALRWTVLGAGGSMIFLSVSNIMTYELPPVPLFWLFPLSIYLLSFVLNFKQRPWCPNWILRLMAPIIGFSALFYFFIQKYDLPPLLEFSLLLGILFCLCMFCQHKLITSKPQQENGLTTFYLLISLGSFLGGIVTTWLIPLVSTSMVEYLCALLVITLAMFDRNDRPLFSARAGRIVIYLNLLYYVWSAVFLSFNAIAVGVLFFLTLKTYHYLNGFRYGVMAVLLVLFMSSPAQEMMWDRKTSDHTWKIRNYYGIHEIVDMDNVRWLYHGRTLHGGQYLSKENQLKPITYYGPQSGIWDVMHHKDLKFIHAAVVGLGTGSMAAFFNDEQSLDIFELDPDVVTIAKEQFTFLKHNRSTKRFFIGDARLSMRSVSSGGYDLILIDAFGGDAIPVHLITQDAFKEYQSYLKPRGAILVHVSNRYVNLVPVLARIAENLGAQMTFKVSRADGEYHAKSIWIFISWEETIMASVSKLSDWKTVDAKPLALRAWSDQYSSLLPILRLDYLLQSLISFDFFSYQKL